MPRKPVAALSATLLASALAVPVAHAAGVSISIRGGDAVTRVSQPDFDRLYSIATTEEMTASCAMGEAVIGAGWSGAGTFVGGGSVHQSDSARSRAYTSLEPRDTRTSGKTRALAICARGDVGAVTKQSKGTTVSCGSGRLALGLVAPNGTPYVAGAAQARATSKSTWTATLGDEPGATAVCVKASAFARVTTVKASATFAAGALTATATATCTGGRRPIGWGVELPAMPGNTYKPSDALNTRGAPFPATSAPSGKSGWRTELRTADFAPAAAPATATIHVTCAVPR